MATPSLPEHLRRVAPAYSFAGPSHVCAYCGQPADTNDHTVPQWLVNGNAKLARRYLFVVVRSCFHCNVLAGRKVDKTFLGRRRRIAEALRRKAHRLLQTAYYDREEVATFGPGLRPMIVEAMAKAEVVRRRLRMLESILLPDGVPNDLWQPMPSEPKRQHPTAKHAASAASEAPPAALGPLA